MWQISMVWLRDSFQNNIHFFSWWEGAYCGEQNEDHSNSNSKNKQHNGIWIALPTDTLIIRSYFYISHPIFCLMVWLTCLCLTSFQNMKECCVAICYCVYAPCTVQYISFHYKLYWPMYWHNVYDLLTGVKFKNNSGGFFLEFLKKKTLSWWRSGGLLFTWGGLL